MILNLNISGRGFILLLSKRLMSNYYKIILSNREIFVMAASKGDSTVAAIEQGKLSKFDLYDVEDILEITERDYNFGVGRRRNTDES